MTDLEILAMPCRRFWGMEKQIGRIKAEVDLRKLAFDGSQNDKEAYRKVVDNLTLELGDTYQIERDAVVKPEADLKLKFKNLK